MEKTLVVLAAGIGSRYGGLKQMEPVGPAGEFLLDYGVYDAMRAGFTRAVFVIRREIEQDFEDVMGARLRNQLPAQYVFQEDTDLPVGGLRLASRGKPWGTGHALWTCREAVDGPFAMINADDFYGRESYDVLVRFLDQTARDPSVYAMVGFTLRNTLSEYGAVARGVCAVNGAGLLKHVVETTGIEKSDDSIFCPNRVFTGDEPVSMNLWGFKPSLFGYLEDELAVFLRKYGSNPRAEFYVPSVVDKLIVDGRVSARVLRTGSTWFGVTYPEDKRWVVQCIAERIAAGEYPESLWG